MTLEIVTRVAWGSSSSKKSWPASIPVKYVFILYERERKAIYKNKLPSKDISSLRSCCREMRYIQRGDCQDRMPLPDIRFNFMIGGDGRVYEGRGWSLAPTLPRRYSRWNRDAIFIGFIGQFIVTPPPRRMLTTMESLIFNGMRRNYINKKHLEYFLY